MKTLDVLAAVLLVIGGLNWGLVGLFNFNMVTAIFGATMLANLVYIIVGAAALYQAVELRAIPRRWGVHAHAH